MKPYRKNMIAEFLGTLFLVVTAIGSVILPHSVFQANLAVTVLINAVSVGFILFALIEIFSPLSGSHFNPAVTLALLISKEVSGKKAGCYIAAQAAGAMAGLVLTHLMFFDIHPVVITLSENTAAWPKYLSEFLCTFLLTGAVFALVRGKSKHTSPAIGMLVGGMIVASSSTMYANPAVSLARTFTYTLCGISPVTALIYIAAELAGALAAVKLFTYLYPKKLQIKCDPYDCRRKNEKFVTIPSMR